jgi:putative salt-induced outer membrane protein
MLYPIAALTTLLLLAFSANAEDKPGFSGRVGLGFLATSGNSESKSLNGNFDLNWNEKPWRHSLSGQIINSSTSGVTTADAFGIVGESKYDMTEVSYIFGLLAFDKDKFSSVDQQTRAAVGYGRRLINTEKHILNAEVGAGSRWADLRDGTSEDEFISRLSADYRWNISETSNFTQTLSVESGSSNTYSEAVSALKAKVRDSLAVVFSYTIKRNSDVSPGLENVDTFTAVSLEYSF